MRSLFATFRYFDLYIFGSSILLLLLGLLMIYSTTLEGPSLLPKQIFSAILGLVIFVMLAFFDYRNFKKITGWLFLLTILALLAVFFFGLEVRGSTRWIDLGLLRFQPAEFAKLVVVIIMAKFLDQSGEKLRAFRYVFLSVIYVGVIAALILIEPDLGSTLIIVLTWLAMLLFSRMNKRHLIFLFAALLVLAALAWQFFLLDYQKARIQTFLNPNEDIRSTGYNVRQSIIAVGSGHVWGRGLGRGFQSQLRFLPERQTDFIFASLAEELGLLGSLLVLCLFFLLFLRILKTIRLSRDNFGMYLALGIFFMLFFQVLINIGMNLGILPVTGVPLPLVSFGGSSLLTTFMAIGLIESIVARQKAVKFAA